MPVTKYGSTKRFGPRYGRRIKEKLGKIEAERNKKHICPYCRKAGVKRKSAGIWHCLKCKNEFTGFAYSISKISTVEEEAPVVEEAQ